MLRLNAEMLLSKMFIHVLEPPGQAPGLDGSVPWSALPVVFPFLGMNPGRQGDREIQCNGCGVRLVLRS